MLAPHRPALRQPLQFLVFSIGVACLCLAAIHAFTLNAMPASADGLLHLYRTVAVERSLRVDHPLWPRYDFDSGAKWDNGIMLHGFSLNATGVVELVLGTDQVLSESLRLFLHALDADGGIAAKWDGVPVDWTRPTTGWVAGEYVIAKHRFSLPVGEYRLRLGWYAPLTGERISVAGADALELEPRLRIE